MPWPSGIITNDEFLRIQGYLGSGYQNLVLCQVWTQSGLNVVVASRSIDVEVDMLQPFAGNVQTLEPSFTATMLRSSTIALEDHIQRKSGQTFNDWLKTNGLKVTQEFADLSGYLGTSIDPANIET